MLSLVFALLVRIRDLTRLIAFEKENLCDPLIGIDLSRQRRRITDLYRYVTFPSWFKRCEIGYDTTPRISRLAQHRAQYIARNPKILNAASECKGVRRNYADLAQEID